MSAAAFRPAPPVGVAPRPGRPAPDVAPPPAPRAGPQRSGPLLPPRAARAAAFLALAAFAAQAWAEMVRPAATGTLLATVLLAALAGAGAAASSRLAPGPARRAAWVALGLGSLVLAFLLAGVPGRLLDTEEWDVLATGLAGGIEALPGLTVPYRGVDAWIRTTILLGGTSLLLLAALLAFRPRALRGDRPPVGAAVALCVLYAVPAVQLRHQDPFLEGAVFAVLLAALLWLERLARREAPLAAVAVVVAAVAGLALAPRLDALDPWLDYESLAQRISESGSSSFRWDHSYGPLRWPRDGREVLRVRADRSAYWKATVLPDFDGLRWRTNEAGYAGEPEADAPRESWVEDLTVSVRDLRTRQFVAAGTTLEVRRSPRRVLTSDVGSFTTAGRPLRRGHAYLAVAYVPRPDREQLERARGRIPRELFTFLTMQLPARVGGPVPRAAASGLRDPRAPAARVGFLPFERGREAIGFDDHGQRPEDGAALLRSSAYARTYALARRLAAGSSSPFDYVRRVQGELSRGFVYTEAPPASRVPLDSFLFRDRQGYCQQFSGAMALLLRMGGVPARVAAGFSPGARDRDSGEYVVRDLDAHSWVEAYFAGIGWVTFDPTPTVAPPRAQSRPFGVAGRLQDEAGRRGGASPERGTDADAIDLGAGGQDGGSPLPAVLLALGGLFAVGAAVVVRRRRRRGRAAVGADAAIAELERALRRVGRPPRPGQTLATLERELRPAPEAAAYLRTVRDARYGWAGDVRPTREQRRALRRELAAGGGALARLRALWALPPG